MKIAITVNTLECGRLMMVVKLETQVQNCISIFACAEASQHAEVSKFLASQYAIRRSLSTVMLKCYTGHIVQKQTRPYDMLLAEGKLCNVIRCLLNPCSKLADTNQW